MQTIEDTSLCRREINITKSCESKKQFDKFLQFNERKAQNHEMRLLALDNRIERARRRKIAMGEMDRSSGFTKYKDVGLELTEFRSKSRNKKRGSS